MSRTSFGLVIAFAFVLVAGFLWMSPGPDAKGEEPSGSKIGYVDITRVFNEYRKVNDRKGELEQKYKAEGERLKAEEKEIEVEWKELELVNQESAQFLQKAEDLQRRRYAVGLKIQLTQREFTLDVNELTKGTYQEILKEVATFAERNGFQLILKIDASNLLEDPDIDPIQYVSNRQILYSAAGRDVTEDLVRILNRNYIPGQSDSTPKKEE